MIVRAVGFIDRESCLMTLQLSVGPFLLIFRIDVYRVGNFYDESVSQLCKVLRITCMILVADDHFVFVDKKSASEDRE
jgi:hypothetical protein